ncbi:hypothetical protein D3C72_2372370 [compost metagenome]
MITVDHPFVPFDTGQGQARLSLDGLGQRQHLGFAAATATATDHAVLDHHVQAPTACCEEGPEISHVVRVVDHAMELEPGVGQQPGCLDPGR